MSGWIRLHRGWRDCEVFAQGAPLSEHEAWLWLLEKAAWKPCVRTNAKGERVHLDRGQLHLSLRALETSWGWGKNKVARFLERLCDHDMIGTVAGQSGQIVTICNYDKYQETEDGRDSQTGTVAGQSRDTHKEGKEGKENKPTARKRARAADFEIPSWVPSDPWAAYCAMRVRKKAPVDSYIAGKLFTKLEEFVADGWDAAKVLDKATLNNWTDLYKPTPGRDDDMRASRSSGAAQPWTPEAQAAYLAKIERFGISDGQPPPPAANREQTTFGAKPLGQILPRISGAA
jgi:hypothetical protein